MLFCDGCPERRPGCFRTWSPSDAAYGTPLRRHGTAVSRCPGGVGAEDHVSTHRCSVDLGYRSTFHLIMTWSNGKLQGPWPCRGILTFTVPSFIVGTGVAGTRTARLAGCTFLLLLIATVALDMGGSRLACSTAMLTLRRWAAFPVDVDQGAICSAVRLFCIAANTARTYRCGGSCSRDDHEHKLRRPTSRHRSASPRFTGQQHATERKKKKQNHGAAGPAQNRIDTPTVTQLQPDGRLLATDIQRSQRSILSQPGDRVEGRSTEV